MQAARIRTRPVRSRHIRVRLTCRWPAGILAVMAQLSFSRFVPRTWEVRDLIRYLRQSIEADFRLQDLWVRGEVSNLSRPGSGHLYFTLKDSEAALRCVMWRTDAVRLGEVPRDGETIEVHGRMGVYEAAGTVQLYADALQRAGEGEAFQEFLRLKARLEAEGLFAAERKREIPGWPARIGIATSPAAAALHDVVQVLRRRLPLAEVVLAPTPVQGEGSPEAIVEALRSLDRFARPDVILLVRGGGSLEDLAAFNDEAVARAIAASKVPVVTGVGHETDVTIADFAADVRAPTPSAAAEIATPDRLELATAVVAMRRRQERAIRRIVLDRRDEVDAAQVSLRRLSPRAVVTNARQRVDDLVGRTQRAVRSQMRLRSEAVAGLAQTLRAVGPEAVLARGYAVVRSTSTGEVVRSARRVRPGDRIEVRVQDGEFPAVAGER